MKLQSYTIKKCTEGILIISDKKVWFWFKFSQVITTAGLVSVVMAGKGCPGIKILPVFPRDPGSPEFTSRDESIDIKTRTSM